MKEKPYAKGSRYNLRIIMHINHALIKEFVSKKSKILAVTKYFDWDETHEYIKKLYDYKDFIIWFWENRITQIIEKKLLREDVHFIGNIQSREIKNLVSYCWYIHSVWSKKHFLKIVEQAELQERKVKIFLQIQLDDKKIIDSLKMK